MESYRWVIVRKGIVDRHIFEEPTDMLIEKTFNFPKAEFRVDKDCTKISFNDIGERLIQQSVTPIILLKDEGTLGGCLVFVQ